MTMMRLFSMITLFLFGLTPAWAAMTEWQDLGGGKARMVAYLDPTNDQVSGVVEIQLEPGWKTYWREPGGSGIPPNFDFSRSKRFIIGEIGYPVPQLLVAGGAAFAGYKEIVRFTFDGRLNSAGGDGLIVLDLLAGVCEEICIPATARFEIPHSDLMVSDRRAILLREEAEQALPGQSSSEFGIDRIERDKGQLVIHARTPKGAEPPALFAEGPTGWYLVPAVIEADNGLGDVVFHLDIGDIPESADPSATQLRYTLVKGSRGVEQWGAPVVGQN